MSDSALRALADDPSSRKRFFKMMGGAGAVSAFSIFLAACGDDDEDEGGTAQTQPETDTGGGAAGDLEIVNYALTLEYLERNFYTAVIDSPLAAELDPMVAELATSIRDNEAEHVDALMATAQHLGGRHERVDVLGLVVAEPEFDFGEAYSSVDTFLRTANIFEDTGVSAYNGAAPDIESTEVLAAAGSIVQVEARHAALIRLQREVSPAPLAFDKASTMDEVLEAVTPFIQS